ncbi:hypothetical protein BKI52_36645 [marine bacterium AO1-C]|nr:hypothetical protein BKI52_36645 [marine bacterium AO1-C]
MHFFWLTAKCKLKYHYIRPAQKHISKEVVLAIEMINPNFKIFFEIKLRTPSKAKNPAFEPPNPPTLKYFFHLICPQK